MNVLCAYDLGLTDYRDVAVLQEKLTEGRLRKDFDDVLLLTEHKPVVTIGRFMKPGDLETELTVPQEKLRELGISLVPTDRGGRLTYHGPGQLVVYPIIHLQEIRLGIKDYVHMLEESVIETVSHFGIEARRRCCGPTGVWVGEGKIAAIGIHVANGVSRHGLALNVDMALHPFGLFIPCGITDMGVTSMAETLKETWISMSDVKDAFIGALSRVFDTDVRPSGGMRECLRIVENSLRGSGRAQST